MKNKAPLSKERIEAEPLFSEKFKGYLLDMMDEKQLKEHTRNGYFLVARSICSFPPEGDYLDVTQEKVFAYFNDAKKNKLKAKAINYRLAVCKSISRYIDAKQSTDILLPFNLIKIEDFTTDFDDADFPSIENINKVLAYFNEHGAYNMFVAASLALELSLSTKDIVELKRKQFQFDGSNQSFIRFTGVNPGNNDRLVYVPDALAAMIEDYVANNGFDFTNETHLILDKKGKPLSARLLQRELRKACEAAGVPNFTFMQLRNTSIAIQLKNGAPADTVAENAGITTRWFTRYSLILPDLKLSPVKYSNIEITWHPITK